VKGQKGIGVAAPLEWTEHKPIEMLLTWYPLRVEEVAQVSQRVRFIVLNSHPTDTVEVQGVARGNEEDRQL